MTEAAAAVATSPAPAAAPVERPSIEARAHALKASYAAEPAEPAAETSEAAETPEAGAGASPSAADSAGTDDARAKAAADRLARIEAMRAKERAKDADRQQRRERKQEAGEVEKLRARLAEVEPLEQVFGSEEALLEMAEKRGMSAEKLVAWMRQRLTDPAAVAKQQAKSEADKVREQVEARLKQIEAERAEERQQLERERAQIAAVQRAATFVQSVTASESHPLSSAFLKKHGEKGLIAFANHFVTPLLPEHYELSELHDHLEQFLEESQVATVLSAPGVSQSSTKKNGAEKPITTLGNAIASERSTVVEEVPLSRLSRDERARRLKEKLARE